MFTNQEQFSNAAKASIEAQIATLTELSQKAFAGITQIVDLNVSVAKASFENSALTAQQLMAAKGPQEFFALSAAQAQPAAEKALAYGRTLADIAAAAHAEFSKTAEAQIAENTRKVTALVDDVAKNAPAGSENAIAMFKTAISNASAGYEQLSKTTKQAADTLGENMGKAAAQFTQAVPKAARKK